MGNREDLLTGARKAVLERGLAKVTARDIASAAGVSLAAIGYHFGTKDRLISEAIAETVGSKIGDGMERAIRDAGEGGTPAQSLAATWDGLLEVIERNRDALLLSVENGVQIARSPESQLYMAEASDEAYAEIAGVLRETYSDLEVGDAEAVAKVLFLLFSGVGLQWLIAPTGAPLRGDDVVRAMRVLGRG